MKNDKTIDGLSGRLDALEDRVEVIAGRLDRKGGLSQGLKKIVSDEVSSMEESLTRSGSWFNRAGIGIFLLGVAYFFKYAVEQGWIVPAVRIALGFLLGGLLLYLGYRVEKKNRTFSQVMLGGAVSVFYITVFAAFHIEKLFPYAVSFLLMVMTTVLAFYVSLKFEDIALSVIGVLGGYGTPFILYSGSGDTIIMVIYACVIFLGSCVLCVYRRWPLVLWVSMAGSWAVFGTLSYTSFVRGAAGPLHADALWVQAGICITWAAQWTALAFRGFLPAPRSGGSDRVDNAGILQGPGAATLLFLLSPLGSLLISMRLWDREQEFWGVMALVLSAFYCGAFIALRRSQESRDTAGIQWKVSLVLLTFALLHLFEGDLLLVTLSAEAVLLHFLISRVDDRALFVSSNVLFVAIRGWIAYRLLYPEGPPEVLGSSTLADAFAIASLMGSCRLIFDMTHARLYFVSTHMLLMLMLWRVISLASGVAGYVTVSWGIAAMALYVGGVIRKSPFLGRVSLGTLGAVVVKLVIYDIPRLGTGYKVLIFTGLGLALLVISYVVQGRRSRAG